MGASRGHKDFKEAAIYRQYHDQGQRPNKKAAQERHDPERNALPKAYVGYRVDHRLWEVRGHIRREAGR